MIQIAYFQDYSRILIINFVIFLNMGKSGQKQKKPNSGTNDYLIYSINTLNTSWNYSAGVQSIHIQRNCIMRFRIACRGVTKCPIELR